MQYKVLAFKHLDFQGAYFLTFRVEFIQLWLTIFSFIGPLNPFFVLINFFSFALAITINCVVLKYVMQMLCNFPFSVFREPCYQIDDNYFITLLGVTTFGIFVLN